MNNLIGMEGYLIGFSVLLVILIHAYKRSSGSNISYSLFICMVCSDMAGLVLECLAFMFDGRLNGFSYIMVRATNIVLYIVCPLPLIFWIFYLEYQIFDSVKRLKNTFKIISLIYFYPFVMSITTLMNNKFFYFNNQNQYQRGPWFYQPLIIYGVFYLYSLYLPINNRNNISKKYFYAMITFLLPAIIGIVLQSLFYGLALIYSSISISILIVYLSIQNKDIENDYLTGLYNRMQLDRYLHDKIKNSLSNKIWAAIMIDIDNFKKINDTYGHVVGDNAIIKTSQIIKNCFLADDMVARFGGDEFVVIVNLKHKEDLNKIVIRLNKKFLEYNESNQDPFNLTVSTGSALFEMDKYANSDEFIDYIDKLMYENKKKIR